MPLTAEQLQITSRIDARVHALVRGGGDDLTVFVDMADDMPGFKRLPDTAHPGDMDTLAARFSGFSHDTMILERVAVGIQSGEITVPK